MKHQPRIPHIPMGQQNTAGEYYWCEKMSACWDCITKTPVDTRDSNSSCCLKQMFEQADWTDTWLLLTGQRSNLSKCKRLVEKAMLINKTKGSWILGAQHVFKGYDKNSPAYWIYFIESAEVQTFCLVKFVTKSNEVNQTQTDMTWWGRAAEGKKKGGRLRFHVAGNKYWMSTRSKQSDTT